VGKEQGNKVVVDKVTADNRAVGDTVVVGKIVEDIVAEGKAVEFEDN
jgi:hypothetical protein